MQYSAWPRERLVLLKSAPVKLYSFIFISTRKRYVRPLTYFATGVDHFFSLLICQSSIGAPYQLQGRIEGFDCRAKPDRLRDF